MTTQDEANKINESEYLPAMGQVAEWIKRGQDVIYVMHTPFWPVPRTVVTSATSYLRMEFGTGSVRTIQVPNSMCFDGIVLIVDHVEGGVDDAPITWGTQWVLFVEPMYKMTKTLFHTHVGSPEAMIVLDHRCLDPEAHLYHPDADRNMSAISVWSQMADEREDTYNRAHHTDLVAAESAGDQLAVDNNTLAATNNQETDDETPH